MARALHADACRDHAIVAWVMLWDLPAYPERYAARLATSGSAPSPYLLLATKPKAAAKTGPVIPAPLVVSSPSDADVGHAVVEPCRNQGIRQAPEQLLR